MTARALHPLDVGRSRNNPPRQSGGNERREARSPSLSSRVVAGLMAFPVLFATGDGHRQWLRRRPPRSTPSSATIRTLESGGDYTAQAARIDRVGRLPVHRQHLGQLRRLRPGLAGPTGTCRTPRPPSTSRASSTPTTATSPPCPSSGTSATSLPRLHRMGHRARPRRRQRLTPRQYQQRWLTEYERQLTGDTDRRRAKHSRHELPARAHRSRALADGYAYPAPPSCSPTPPSTPPTTTTRPGTGVSRSAPRSTPSAAAGHGRAVLAAQLVGPRLRRQRRRLPHLRDRRHHRRRRRQPVGLLPRQRRPRPTSATRSPPGPRSSPPATPAARVLPTSTSRSAPPTDNSAAPNRSCGHLRDPASASTRRRCRPPAATTGPETDVAPLPTVPTAHRARAKLMERSPAIRPGQR